MEIVPPAAVPNGINMRPPFPLIQEAQQNEGPTSRPWIWAIGIVDVVAVIFSVGILVHDIHLKQFEGKPSILHSAKNKRSFPRMQW